MYTAVLKFEHQVEYSSLIHDLCCLLCNMKIKQDIEKSADPQNNPVFTSNSPSTEGDCTGKQKLSFSLVQNRTSEKHCMSHSSQVFR